MYITKLKRCTLYIYKSNPPKSDHFCPNFASTLPKFNQISPHSILFKSNQSGRNLINLNNQNLC